MADRFDVVKNIRITRYTANLELSFLSVKHGLGTLCRQEDVLRICRLTDAIHGLLYMWLDLSRKRTG